MTKRLVLLALITACAGKSGTGAPPPTAATDSAAAPATDGSAAMPAPATDGSATMPAPVDAAAPAPATSFATVPDLTAAFAADPALAGKEIDVKGKLGVLTQQKVGGAVVWDVAIIDDPKKPGAVGVWCRIKDADKDAAQAVAKAAGTIVARGKLGTVKKGAKMSTMLDECSITAS